MMQGVSTKQAVQWMLVLLDVVFINVSFYIAYVVRYELGIPYPVDPRYDAPFYPSYITTALLLTGLCLLMYRIDGLYERKRGRRWLEEVYRLVNSTMTSIVVIMAITFFTQPLVYSRGMLVLAGVEIVIVLSTVRLLVHWVEDYLRRRGIGTARVLIVGAGDLGRAVMRSILGSPELGYQIVGYVDDDPSKGDGHLGRLQGYGGLNRLPQIIESQRVSEVIVTLPWMYHRKIMQIVSDCERGGVRVRIVPDVFQQRMHRVDIDSLNGIPLLGPGPSKLSHSALLIKRFMDLALVVLALLPLAVIFVVVAVLIKLDSPGPIFYKQPRVGKDGRLFDIYKLRTMVVGADKMQAELAALNEADGPLFKIRDDPRRTRLGRFLRRTSIDELPQFINVLRGEMSIVGPRPGTPDEFERYEPWHRERVAVRPGITGLWQVSGRSDIPFDEMVLLDIFYIENWSLDLDIRIMLQTIPNALFGNGAY